MLVGSVPFVLQECVLNVDVERIGYFDPVPSGTLTPRSFQAAPLKHDQLSRLISTLSKVSGGVDRETESNAQVCSSCALLHHGWVSHIPL